MLCAFNSTFKALGCSAMETDSVARMVSRFCSGNVQIKFRRAPRLTRARRNVDLNIARSDALGRKSFPNLVGELRKPSKT